VKDSDLVTICVAKGFSEGLSNLQRDIKNSDSLENTVDIMKRFVEDMR
jgi:hypothetical protein